MLNILINFLNNINNTMYDNLRRILHGLLMIRVNLRNICEIRFQASWSPSPGSTKGRPFCYFLFRFVCYQRVTPWPSAPVDFENFTGDEVLEIFTGISYFHRYNAKDIFAEV